MPTVAHITEQLLADKPFVQEALRRGIVNHAALAESLIPEIKRVLRKDVKFSAVNMALHRLADRLASRPMEKMRFTADSDITIRSHLTEITLFTAEGAQERLPKLYGIVDLKHGDFLTITQGLHEVMIITNAKHASKILSLFPKRAVRKTIHGLSSITLHIPAQATQASGMFYLVTRQLAWENINIIDIVSTYTELTFIIGEHDTGRAFTVLKDLIQKKS